MKNIYKYYAIYKPYLVLSQFTSEGGNPGLSSIYDLPKDVYPIGRLDHDSEGLLLLTNDNYLKNRLLDPKFDHKKVYYIQVDGAISNEAVLELMQGPEIKVNGKTYKTKPCKAELINNVPTFPERIPPVRFRKEIPTSWIKLELTEGKNRQARKMTAKVGYPTLRLIRASIENIELNGLLPGLIREYSKSDFYKLLKIK